MVQPNRIIVSARAHSFGPSGLANFLGVGRGWLSASFDDSALFIATADQTRRVPFTSFRARHLQVRWLFGGIRIEIANSAPIVLGGMWRSKARVAFASLSRAIDEAATNHLRRNTEQILATTNQIAQALIGRRYIAHSEAAQLREQVASYLFLLWTRPNAKDTNRILEIIKSLETFYREHESIRANANTKFIANELVACAEFFRTVEKTPLSDMQMQATLTDEDATLVLASAGSGKTSVIISKVAYLLHRTLREPQEILLLAFSRETKKEIETRLEKRVGQPVHVSTFHALGLAIIGDCEGRRPDVSVLSTDSAKLRRFIQDRLEGMLRDTPELRTRVVTWFTEYLVPYRGAEEFGSAGAYYHYLRSHTPRSLKGDLVKSHEELTIANFLFVNGIDYQYEAPYEYDTATSKKGQYKPDFKIGDKGLYIEHFAIDREGRTPPFIAQTDYTASMDWKREQHRAHNTQLIETYSWQNREGSLLSSLESSLREVGVVFNPLSSDELLEPLRRLKQIDRFSALVATFLHHAQSTQLNPGDLRAKAEGRPDASRMRAFLDVFEPIQKAYREELAGAGEIDFADMVLRAARYLEEGRYKSSYRAIIVDEFQDISVARARLLKGLLHQNPHNRLFAVGDDWQSIYRFAGSDISVMRQFAEWFGYSKQAVLGQTFRLNQLLSDLAADFVCKNPFQLPKKVTSNEKHEGPPLTIISKIDKTTNTLSMAFDSIANRTSQQRASVQLLGRYNFNKPQDLSVLKSNFPNLDIEFLTIHRSKGLEADFVVVLDVIADRYGFPNEIVDDPILSLVLAEAELYPNAEERRLFYVALTRARIGVYLLTDNSESSFLTELRGRPGVDEILTRRPDIPESCPKCQTGRLVERKSLGRIFLGCVNFPYCKHTQQLTLENDRPHMQLYK